MSAYYELTEAEQRKVDKTIGSAEYQVMQLVGQEVNDQLQLVYDANEFKIERGKAILENIAEYGDETRAWYYYLITNIDLIDDVVVPCSEWILRNIYTLGQGAKVGFNIPGYVEVKSASYNGYTISKAEAEKILKAVDNLYPEYNYPHRGNNVYLNRNGNITVISRYDNTYIGYPVIGITGTNRIFYKSTESIASVDASTYSWDGETLTPWASGGFGTHGNDYAYQHAEWNAHFYEMSLRYSGYIEYANGTYINHIYDRPAQEGIEQAYNGVKSDVIWNVNGVYNGENVGTSTDVIVIDGTTYPESAQDLAGAIADVIEGEITVTRDIAEDIVIDESISLEGLGEAIENIPSLDDYIPTPQGAEKNWALTVLGALSTDKYFVSKFMGIIFALFGMGVLVTFLGKALK